MPIGTVGADGRSPKAGTLEVLTHGNSSFRRRQHDRHDLGARGAGIESDGPRAYAKPLGQARDISPLFMHTGYEVEGGFDGAEHRRRSAASSR